MSSCTKIRLRETPPNFPEQYIEADGCVYLDLANDFTYTVDKVLEKLLDVGQIDFNKNYASSFQVTDKMEYILSCYLEPNTVGQQYSNIPIDVIQNGCIISDYELNIQEANTTINGLIELDRYHWANLMQELTLCDLYEGEIYTHRCIGVTELGNTFIYDESTPYWLPTVDYGAFIWNNTTNFEPNNNITLFNRRRNICNSYRRPHLFSADILQRLFCKINYTLKSEITEKELAKRLIEYQVSPDFGLDLANELDTEIIPAVTYQLLNQPQTIIDAATDDPFGNYQSGFYCGNGKVTISFRLTLNFFTETLEDKSVIVNFYKGTKDPSGGFQAVDFQRIVDQVEFDTTNTELNGDGSLAVGIFEAEDIEVDNSECSVMFFQFQAKQPVGGTVFVQMDQENSYIRYTGVRKFFDTDREYNYEDILNCKNMLDWFKGYVHLFELKMSTDVSNRCLIAEPPYKTTIDEEQCEGFFLDECIDLSEQVVSKTRNLKSPDNNLERYVRKQFKNSTDTFISNKELDEEPLSLLLDRGENYRNDNTKDVVNNCYEPTLNKKRTLPEGNEITLPHIKSDGNERCQSWSIKSPRILCTYGSVRHGTSTDDYLAICDEFTNLIPTAYQFEREQLIGDTSNDPNANLVLPGCNLTFEQLFDDDGNQLFSLHVFAIQWYLEEYNTATYTFDVNLDPFLFDCIDFRKLALFYDKGKPIVARITEVLDFNRCSEDLTKMSFKTLADRALICSSSSTNSGGGDCQNFPTITCIKDGECHIFMIGGSIQSVISNVTFYKKGNPNVQIPNSTPVSAELCGETEQYQVCAVVSFEGDCPDVTTAIKTVFPCSNSQPEIICQGFYKSENGYCVNAVIGGQIFDNYTIIEFLADGEDYTEGSDLCGLSIGQTVNFTAIIDFDDACDPIELELDCLIPTPPGSCDDNQASIGFEEDENGCCKPIIVEDCLVEQPENCLFWYACLPEGQQPTKEDEILYTGPEFLCCPDGHVLWVKAMLFFCGTCDPLCIEWTQAVKDGCCNFQNIECSNCIAEVTDPCEGYSYVWYSLPDQTEPSNEPPFTADFVRTNYAVFQLGTSANLLDDVEMWYAVIGRKDGCPDSINYYFHDAPNAGEDTILTL